MYVGALTCLSSPPSSAALAVAAHSPAASQCSSVSSCQSLSPMSSACTTDTQHQSSNTHNLDISQLVGNKLMCKSLRRID